MKLLLDTCVSGHAKRALIDLGHDVDWSGDWATDPGDEAILAKAYAEHRILVTLDKDFGELALFRGHRHCGIIRLVQTRSMDQGGICAKVIERYAEQLALGAIVTAEPARVRIRSSE